MSKVGDLTKWLAQHENQPTLLIYHRAKRIIDCARIKTPEKRLKFVRIELQSLTSCAWPPRDSEKIRLQNGTDVFTIY